MALQEVEFDYVVDVVTSVVKGTNKGIDEAIKLDNFRTYLEDLILYESVARTYVEIGGKGDYPTPNIRAALIASEINRDGKLEDGTRISLVRKYMKAEDYLNAKFKIKQFENKYMGSLKEVLAEASQKNAKILVYNAHMDVVTADNTEDWTDNPFKAVRRR